METLEPTDHNSNQTTPAPEVSSEASLKTGRFPHLKRIGLGIFLSTLFLLGALSYGIASTENSNESQNNLGFLSSIKRLASAGESNTSLRSDDRITALLLGIGGAGHDGPELTDTMMLISFKPSTKELGVISIPRDLGVDLEGYGLQKINHANAYAENKDSGSGKTAAAKVVSQIFDEPIDYTVKVDFGGFAEIIDAMGGVDVMVDNSFTDYSYPIDGMEDADCAAIAGITPAESDPSASTDGQLLASTDGQLTVGTADTNTAPAIPNCRVKTLEFTKGQTLMNGETALAFARSRHGNNGEGSDFARAARQQKILLAVKDKLTAGGTILNPKKLNDILGVIKKNIDTDISLWDMVKLAKYAPDVSLDRLTSHVIDGASGLVYDTSVNGSYFILPFNGDWRDFKALAENIFNPNAVTAKTLSHAIPHTDTELTIEIQNGTPVNGLARDTATVLQGSGIKVVAVGNATDRTFADTVIVDFTDGQKDEELLALQKFLNAKVYLTAKGFAASTIITADKIVPIEDWKPLSTSPADFLVIIGANHSL